MLARSVRVLRALLDVPLARPVVAAGVRAVLSVSSLLGRGAMLDERLAARAGLRSRWAPAPSCPLAIDPPRPAPAVDLDAIPSETTASERRFLYAFFAHLWRGEADVVEVGPFLGGTTRAIALGMLANPRRRPEAKVYVYDRFGGYWEPEDLAEFVEPLLAAGILDAADREAALASGSFRHVFEAVHRATDYVDLIETRDRPLPDTPEEAATAEVVFELDPGVEVDAVFVDGCKSWYATKYFMRSVLAVARPGTHVIFQDYGWYTCFWLPAFVHAMGAALVPVASVSTTRAFHVVEPLNPAAIEDRFPDDPADLGRAWFATAFDTLRREAAARDDSNAAAVLGLQHGAALAYLGDVDAARERIARARSEIGWTGDLSPVAAAAARSPTYRPGGEPIRL